MSHFLCSYINKYINIFMLSRCLFFISLCILQQLPLLLFILSVFSFFFRFFFVVPSLFVYFVAFNFFLPSVFFFLCVFLFMFLYKLVFIFLFCIIFFQMRRKYQNSNIIYIYLNAYLCFYLSVSFAFSFSFQWIFFSCLSKVVLLFFSR